jgi:hypothetical protein
MAMTKPRIAVANPESFPPTAMVPALAPVADDNPYHWEAFSFTGLEKRTRAVTNQVVQEIITPAPPPSHAPNDAPHLLTALATNWYEFAATWSLNRRISQHTRVIHIGSIRVRLRVVTIPVKPVPERRSTPHIPWGYDLAQRASSSAGRRRKAAPFQSCWAHHLNHNNHLG